MPVVERVAHLRERGLWKFKEKRKFSMIMELVVCGLLIVITTDTAYRVYECVQHCASSSRRAPPHFDPEVMGYKIPVFVEPQNFIVTDPPPDFHKRFKAATRSENSLKNALRTYNNCSEYQRQPQDDMDWGERGYALDPTKKNNNTNSRDVQAVIDDILRDYAVSKDKDAFESLFRQRDFGRKATLGSIVIVSSF